MVIPKNVWGLVEKGKYVGSKVIVTRAELGGWDVSIYPPSPSVEEWNHWADDENELAGYFSQDTQEANFPEWIWPGLLPLVKWGVEPPQNVKKDGTGGND